MPPWIRETYPVGLLACNCTLLGDPASGDAVVIDPGLSEHGGPSHLLSRLTAHRLQLRQILITHAHIDHVGGALALKRATGAPILMHQADLPLLHAMEMQANWLGIDAPEVSPPDASADHGTRVGLNVLHGEVLHTPGHTPGSICVFFPQADLLFAGDTLFAGSIGRTDLPGGDPRLILRSIHTQLLALPETTLVIAGHGAETTIGAERDLNPYLRAFRR